MCPQVPYLVPNPPTTLYELNIKCPSLYMLLLLLLREHLCLCLSNQPMSCRKFCLRKNDAYKKNETKKKKNPINRPTDHSSSQRRNSCRQEAGPFFSTLKWEDEEEEKCTSVLLVPSQIVWTCKCFSYFMFYVIYKTLKPLTHTPTCLLIYVSDMFFFLALQHSFLTLLRISSWEKEYFFPRVFRSLFGRWSGVFRFFFVRKWRVCARTRIL